MDELQLPWIAVAGAFGGALNAYLTDNRRVLPTKVLLGANGAVIRPGLLVSALIGGFTGGAAFAAFAGPASSPVGSSAPVRSALVVGLLLGALAARWISNETDKRLLRAAACHAASAPAAHPDTVSEMEDAPPHRVFETAARLVPQYRRR